MPKVRVKKNAKGKRYIRVKVKRKSNINVNKNSVRVSPGAMGIPFGAVAGAGGGGGGSSSSTTVVTVPVPGPAQIQTAGVTDSTSKDDFRTLRNDIHEGIAGGFNALINNYFDASPSKEWKRTSDFIPPQPDLPTVMTNDIGNNQPQEIPMDVANVQPPSNEMPNNQNQGTGEGAPVATVGSGAGSQALVQQPPAQGVRQQTEFERLMERQRYEAAQREQVADQMDVAMNNYDPRDGMVAGNLRIQKRKPIVTDARLAPEAQAFINNASADVILNRGQDQNYLRNQFNGGAALGIYQNRLGNNRFEKAARQDGAGNAFEIERQRYPALPPQQNAIVQFEDDDDF
jgi:hypothetical protein